MTLTVRAVLKRSVQSALVLLLALPIMPTGAHAQSANPYTLQQIIVLLEGGFSGAEVLRRVTGACISFRVGTSSESDLRRAGADDALLTGLRSVCYRGGAAAPPAVARGIVSIMGELPPGWARVVNELPPSTNREIDLTPGRQAVIVVTAPGWCPDRREVTLASGDTMRWTPTLRGKPWIGGC